MYLQIIDNLIKLAENSQDIVKLTKFCCPVQFSLYMQKMYFYHLFYLIREEKK